MASNCAVCEHPLAEMPVSADVPLVCRECANDEWPHPGLPSSEDGVFPDRYILDRAEAADE